VIRYCLDKKSNPFIYGVIMPKSETVLNIGDKAPAFNLSTCQGAQTTLEQILKNGPAYFLFFRGTW
jgi:hypothetical protein